MAICAQRDPIALVISSHVASVLSMVNLEIFVAATTLAAPPVPLQHLLAEDPVALRVESPWFRLHWIRGHDAIRLRSRNRCCSVWGRKP